MSHIRRLIIVVALKNQQHHDPLVDPPILDNAGARKAGPGQAGRMSHYSRLTRATPDMPASITALPTTLMAQVGAFPPFLIGT